MGINQKLMQFVDFLDVSQRKFTNTTGLAEGALRGGRSVSVESLIKIKQTYPTLNLDWVLFDKGEMVLKGDKRVQNDEPFEYNTSIDDLVDQKIDERFADIKDTLAELVANEIEKELDKAKASTKSKS